MEHTDVILSDAVDRYLLGEMTEDEQRIFEEHYFDCRVCAVDVTNGARMMMSGRVVAAADAQSASVVPMPVPRFRWLPSAAAASLIFSLLGGGVGYRLAINQRHDPPARIVRIVPITGIVRSETPQAVPTVQSGDILRFDVTPDDDAARYTAQVVCGGKTQFTLGISQEMAADVVPLQPEELPLGRCELVIEGVRKDGNRFEITRMPFEVRERTGVR